MFIDEAAWFSFAIGVAVKSTAILCVAWFSALILRRRSAAARHLVWTAAAAGALALPFLTALTPELPFPAPAAFRPAIGGAWFSAASMAESAASVSAGTAERGTPADPKSTPWHLAWKTWLMLAWAAGTAAILGRMLVACALLWRARRTSKPIDGFDDCAALPGSLGIRQRVELLESEAGSMPITFGVLRPAVFMPANFAEWSDERRRMVLLHELAHVKRGDVFAHLIARGSLSVCWWNPLAWVAWRELLREGERATDDMVLGTGARASDYASHLLDVARSMQTSRDIGCAAVAMARPSQLEGRLRAILDNSVSRTTSGSATVFATVLLAVGIAVPFAAVQAQDGRKAEALENEAKAAEQRREFGGALQLLESAASARAKEDGEYSVSYGLSLLNLGELNARRKMHEAAEVRFEAASKILGERPEAARALIHLGSAAIRRKDFRHAIDHFGHALRIDPANTGLARMWMAVVRQAEQRAEEAEALYKSALDAQHPRSTEAASIAKVYSRFLLEQGRAEEAADLESRAVASQKANPSRVDPRSVAPGVLRTGGDVTPPSLLQKKEPEYSEEARSAKLTGRVKLYVEIGPDGMARNITAVERLGLGLDEQAIDAIGQWRFKPGERNGQPVTVAATIEVNFRLQ
ncbi:MAG: TonB family protein [Bryobacterales bacterium]|nr:TonB family protein [Bryobacterales bacterium]